MIMIIIMMMMMLMIMIMIINTFGNNENNNNRRNASNIEYIGFNVFASLWRVDEGLRRRVGLNGGS